MKIPMVIQIHLDSRLQMNMMNPFEIQLDQVSEKNLMMVIRFLLKKALASSQVMV